jgi:hypothetical protein
MAVFANGTYFVDRPCRFNTVMENSKEMLQLLRKNS